MTTTIELHAVGFNDEQDVCNRCGKPELRGTVILADSDGVEAGRYGTSCAAKIIAESTGRKTSITRGYALARELSRRDSTMRYLNRAAAALADNDPAMAQWYIWDMKRDALAFPHRADELAIVAAVNATGSYISIGRNTTPEGIRHSYMLRVKYGKRRVGTSLAPETV